MSAEIKGMPALPGCILCPFQSITAIITVLLLFGLARRYLDTLGLLCNGPGMIVWGVCLPRLRGQLELLLPMLVHRLINIIISVTWRAILQVVRSEMWSRICQSAAREVMLVANVVGRLARVCKRLLRMRMGLTLKFGELHAESLMGLTAIHEDMLPLVGLSIHGEWI